MTTLETQLQQLKASISDSFDLVYRNVTIKEHRCVLVFLSSLSDSALISDIVESIVITTNQGVALTLYPGSVEAQRNLHKAITALLSGQWRQDIIPPVPLPSQAWRKAYGDPMTVLLRTSF